jgi:hypothetical protein
MSDDRKMVALDPDVFEALKQHKGKHETWNQYALALAELADEHHDPVTLGADD